MKKIVISLSILTAFIPAIIFAEVTCMSVKNSDGTQTKIFYSKGKEIAKQTQGTDGKIKTTGKIPDGLVKELLDNGKIKDEWNYKNGKLEGISKEYFASGALLEEIMCKNDKREGISKKYYENGKLLAERNFKNGEQEGISKMFFESGKVFAELNYKNGKLDGTTNIYYENGKMRSAETYKDGQKIGVKAYNQDGKLVFEKDLLTGKETKIKTETKPLKDSKPEETAEKKISTETVPQPEKGNKTR